MCLQFVTVLHADVTNIYISVRILHMASCRTVHAAIMPPTFTRSKPWSDCFNMMPVCLHRYIPSIMFDTELMHPHDLLNCWDLCPNRSENCASLSCLEYQLYTVVLPKCRGSLLPLDPYVDPISKWMQVLSFSNFCATMTEVYQLVLLKMFFS